MLPRYEALSQADVFLRPDLVVPSCISFLKSFIRNHAKHLKGLLNHSSFKSLSKMQTHILGYPRIGSKRELKKACEQYWAGKLPVGELLKTGRKIRMENWQLQKDKGIDLIPSNDFSYYDQVLDMSLTVGAIPERYHKVILNKSNSELDLYSPWQGVINKTDWTSLPWK